MQPLKHALLPLLLCCGVARAQESLEKYEIILQRKPFGSAAAESSASSQKSADKAPAPADQSPYRLCAIYEDIHGQPRVGLVHKETKASLTLPDPNSQALQLISIDFQNDRAEITENGSPYTLVLTSVPVEPPKSSNPTDRRSGDRSSSSRDRGRDRNDDRNSGRGSGKDDQSGGSSRLRGSQLKEHLQNYQMEVIRRGLPALPIPLTTEMDQQLVEEGVLPAQ
jgi:hypothetical protein